MFFLKKIFFFSFPYICRKSNGVAGNDNIYSITALTRVDWRLWSNYSMELPSFDVGLEDRSCRCDWQYCRS